MISTTIGTTIPTTTQTTPPSTARTWFKILASLLWLAPVANSLRYWQTWNRLPLRMATHFDAAGRANGWMTPQVSLYYSAGSLAFAAAVFFGVLFFVQAKYPLARLSWALLAFFHAEIWALVYVLNSMIAFSLGESAIAISPLPVVTALGLLVIVPLAFFEKRGPVLAGSEVLAEEVHAGKRLAAILILGAGISLLLFFATPNTTSRVAFAAIGVVMLSAVAMAWDGFHYYFSRNGVEIRTLGFRLKSIPLGQIKTYEIQSWNPVRGFGIRGIGNCKAYVWGTSGVRVHTSDGEIFLGHGDPQRIVHDLNVIKRYQLS